MKPVFSDKILHKYTVQYYQCPQCEYLCTEEPYWLKEAYANPINDTDTGILVRNILYSRIISGIIFVFFSKTVKCLDYGGGYGIFTRLMRDIGFDYYWSDPYTENMFAKGFEYSPDMNDIGLITSFENFEHFVTPLTDVKKIMDISSSIIFSTKVLPCSVPKPGEWWYYGLEHGQHVSFYSEKTLQTIANKLDLHYYPINHDVHLFSPRKINNILLYVIKKFYWIISPIIKLLLQTKIFEDMEYLKTRQ